MRLWWIGLVLLGCGKGDATATASAMTTEAIASASATSATTTTASATVKATAAAKGPLTMKERLFAMREKNGGAPVEIANTEPLSNAYAENEVRADAKFKGKPIAMVDVAIKVGKTDDKAYVLLQHNPTGDDLKLNTTSLFLYLDESDSQSMGYVAEIDSGDVVTVLCEKFEGKSDEVLGKTFRATGCVLLDKPSKAKKPGAAASASAAP